MADDAKSLQQQLDTQRLKVDVDHYDLTLRELVRMAVEGEMKLAPAYQRKFRWSHYDESRLIESLFLGLPVPSIYVATNKDGTWEVVDGLQRISTLIHFLSEAPQAFKMIGQKEPLRLEKLEKLAKLNGKTFKELPTSVQISFPRRPLRVTALSDKSDKDVRFDMFDRLNRGGIVLTAQEVRACIFRGRFAKMLRRLGNDENFKTILKLQKAKQNDGTREELVLKFFAYLNNRQAFQGDVKNFLNDYMAKASEDFDRTRNKALFLQVAAKLHELLRGRPFLRTNVKITPQNELEAVMVAIGEIFKSGNQVISPPTGWQDDEALVKYSSKGTNSVPMLNGRINRAIELLSGKTALEILAQRSE